jgi:putative phosphoesterase
MRLGLFSDPHGNLPGLEAVLAALDGEGVDRLLCAGDIVGYNPFPNEVIALLQDRDVLAIRGNHDRAALTGNTTWFNPVAALALDWTRARLTPASFAYLQGLKDRARLPLDDRVVAVFHGSPRDDDEYVYPWNVSDALVAEAKAEIVVLGHTHVPLAMRYDRGVVVNPGSAGQPRDGNWRAAYAVLDTETLAFEVKRVEYDVGRVAEAIGREGLPSFLAERLYRGV